MMTILTAAEQRYIKQNYKIESANSMAKRFGVSGSCVTKLIRYWGLVITEEDRFNIRSNGQSTATLKEDNFIRKHYLTMPVRRIAEKLNRYQAFVRTRLEVLGLTIPREIIEQRIKDSRIKAGHVPVNKGRKMSRKQYKKCRGTMFKKGSKPGNTLYDGAITIRTDSRGVPQKYIRLSEGKWEYLSRYNWIKNIGPIPKSCVIAFVDGDTMKCEISNLMMLPKAANAERNRVTKYPKEVQEVIKLNNKLKRAIHAKKQDRGSAQSPLRSSGRTRR